MAYCKIVGTGSFLPKKQVTNADLERLVDTTDEWIVKRVGIKRRHQVSGDENTSYMAHQATKNAMEQAQISPNDLDLINSKSGRSINMQSFNGSFEEPKHVTSNFCRSNGENSDNSGLYI